MCDALYSAIQKVRVLRFFVNNVDASNSVLNKKYINVRKILWKNFAIMRILILMMVLRRNA